MENIDLFHLIIIWNVFTYIITHISPEVVIHRISS